jgi:hypothetical protein
MTAPRTDGATDGATNGATDGATDDRNLRFCTVVAPWWHC